MTVRFVFVGMICAAGFLASPAASQTVRQLPPPPERAALSAGAATALAQPRIVDRSVRIKDITTIAGDRSNVVTGIGLVTGLAGTGGRAEQTQEMARNYFRRHGINVDNLITQNMSVVNVSAEVPAFARKGETISNVNVSVLDDAQSLRGGQLLTTFLRGMDNEIYAVAEGPLTAGGLAAGGAAASVQKNHPTAGKCQATLEREICCESTVDNNGRIRLILQNKDYKTATHIANAINGVFPDRALALDSGTVAVIVPRRFLQFSDSGELQASPTFISRIGELRVQPDVRARVVINQKTGTILMGQNVRISRVLFASENIVISTTENPIASQPAPLSGGQTPILPRTNVDVFESGGTYNVLPDSISVGELAKALNTLAVSPTTMIDLFTSLQNQGALQAELIIE